MTAAHVVQAALQALEAYRQFGSLSKHAQRKQVEEFPDTTITHAGVRWGSWDNPSVEGELIRHPTADLALFRLSGFRNPAGFEPPVFREDIAPGESVCRVGYALLDDISASFRGNSLHLDQVPPLFVNEGIVSRYVDHSSNRHIEVTSPGLLGQSGGPVADTKARVCGIQVRTRHYRLGFGGDSATHHVGQALSAGVVCEFLRRQGVDHQVEKGTDANHE